VQNEVTFNVSSYFAVIRSHSHKARIISYLFTIKTQFVCALSSEEEAFIHANLPSRNGRHELDVFSEFKMKIEDGEKHEKLLSVRIFY
jgi:hypothetical protein